MARIVHAVVSLSKEGIPMRENLVGLLAAALMAVCGVASANIIYSVDLSGGGETVKGTITTNGTLGALTSLNIVAWNLSATGLVDLSVVSPGSEACQSPAGGGCGVTAEADGTLVETGAGIAPFLAFYVGAPPSAPVISFEGSAIYVILAYGAPDGQIDVGRLAVLGTAASAPEPPTAILLAIGLVGLGSVYMRARGRQRAAV
jgi:hypothetical protein